MLLGGETERKNIPVEKGGIPKEQGAVTNGPRLKTTKETRHVTDGGRREGSY